MYRSRLLLITLPFLALLHITHANFGFRDIPGHYSKKKGSSSCLHSIRIRTISKTVTSSNILLSGTLCTSGSIIFLENPNSDFGNNLTRLLLRPPYSSKSGIVVVGNVTSTLTCPTGANSLEIAQSRKLNFFRPKSTFQFDFGAISNSSDSSLQGNFEFVRSVRYLVLGSHCIYSKFQAAEPDRGEVSSIWTWLGPLLGVVLAVVGAMVALCAGHCVHARRQSEKLAMGDGGGGLGEPHYLPTRYLDPPAPHLSDDLGGFHSPHASAQFPHSPLASAQFPRSPLASGQFPHSPHSPHTSAHIPPLSPLSSRSTARLGPHSPHAPVQVPGQMQHPYGGPLSGGPAPPPAAFRQPYLPPHAGFAQRSARSADRMAHGFGMEGYEPRQLSGDEYGGYQPDGGRS